MSNVVLIKHPVNWGLQSRSVREAALGVLKERGLEGVELSLVFVGRKKARGLNVRYRKMEYIPQVLSFPMDRKMLGDIVICTSKLKYESRLLKKEINTILTKWLSHGIDNLLTDI